MTTALAPTSFKRGFIVKSFTLNRQSEMEDASYSLRCTCGHQEVFQELPLACPNCSCETCKKPFPDVCHYDGTYETMHDQNFHYISHCSKPSHLKATILIAQEDVRNFDDEDALSFVYIASQYFFDATTNRITSTKFKRRVRYDKLNGRLHVIGGGIRDYSYLPGKVEYDLDSRFCKRDVFRTPEQDSHYNHAVMQFKELLASYIKLPTWLSSRLEKEGLSTISSFHLVPVALLPLGIELFLNLSVSLFQKPHPDTGNSLYIYQDDELDMIRFTRNHASLKEAFDTLLKVDSSYFMKVLMRHSNEDAISLLQFAHRLAGAFKDSNHFNSAIDSYSEMITQSKELSKFVHLKKLFINPESLFNLDSKSHSPHQLFGIIKGMKKMIGHDTSEGGSFPAPYTPFYHYYSSLNRYHPIYSSGYGFFKECTGYFSRFKRMFRLSEKRMAQLLCREYAYLSEMMLSSNENDYAHIQRASPHNLVADILRLGKAIQLQYPNFEFGKFTTFYQLHERLIRVFNRLNLSHFDFELKKPFKQMTGTYGVLDFDIAESNTRLSDIGKSLSICVGSYQDVVKSHSQYIFYAHTDNQYALCISVSLKTKTITQVKGYRNNAAYSIPDSWIDSVHLWATKHGLSFDTNDMYSSETIPSRELLPLMPMSFIAEEPITYTIEELNTIFDLRTKSRIIECPKDFILEQGSTFGAHLYQSNVNRILLKEDAISILTELAERYLPGYEKLAEMYPLENNSLSPSFF